MFAVRSEIPISIAAIRTGDASTIRTDVERMAQTKIGSLVHVRPGARMVRIVAIRLSPVSARESPIRMNAQMYASIPARASSINGA